MPTSPFEDEVLTVGAVDAGEKPAVLSAVVKAWLTEAMRDMIDDAMAVRSAFPAAANVDRFYDLYVFDSTNDATTNYDRVLAVPLTIGVSLNCSMPAEMSGVPGIICGSQKGSSWYCQVAGSSRLQAGS